MAFLAAALPYIAAGSGVIGALSSLSAGRQAKAADTYNTQVAANDASEITTQAQLQAKQDQRQAALDEGTIEANLGASGSAGGGSGADVSMDVRNQHNLQANTDLYLGQVAANRYLSNQQVSQYQADQAIPSSILSAGGALLQGGFNAAKAYNQLNPQPQVEF